MMRAVLVRGALCVVGVAMATAMALVVSVAWAAGPLPAVGVFGGDARAGAFAQVLGPREFEFPRDHGPHPEYRQEWWYVTGNLDAAGGERFGFELTFFRFALAPEGTSDSDAQAQAQARAVVTGAQARAQAQAQAQAVMTGAQAGAQVTGAQAQAQLSAAPEHVTGPRLGAVAQPPSLGVESAWRTGQIYMAHFAITDATHKQFRFTQKLSRGAVGLAGARMPPLHVWIDDWSLGTVDEAGTNWTLRAAESGYELTLDAHALQPPVLNGDRGFSRKSSDPGSASYYYSIPRVAVRGRLVRDGKPLEVQGLAWVDREWGSGTLSSAEQGWDWFALQLEDGSSLMFYSLRNHDGGRDPNSAGTWIGATGQSRPLSSAQVQIDVLDYWKNPRGERYPAHWRVRVPTEGIDVDVRPVLANQELIASTRYWEGAVDVTGASASAGQKTGGRGYVELVGYAAQ